MLSWWWLILPVAMSATWSARFVLLALRARARGSQIVKGRKRRMPAITQLDPRLLLIATGLTLLSGCVGLPPVPIPPLPIPLRNDSPAGPQMLAPPAGPQQYTARQWRAMRRELRRQQRRERW